MTTAARIQLRTDCARLSLHLAWLKAGVPDTVTYVPEESKLDAAVERLTRHVLAGLNEKGKERP